MKCIRCQLDRIEKKLDKVLELAKNNHLRREDNDEYLNKRMTQLIERLENTIWRDSLD